MTNYLMSLSLRVVLAALLVAAAACSGVEQGTGQALDNLGGVIKSESSKIWIPAGEEERHDADKNRY